jgi:hypothetical protein
MTGVADVAGEIQQSLSGSDVAVASPALLSGTSLRAPVPSTVEVPQTRKQGSKLAEKIKAVQTVTIDPRRRKPATKPVAQTLPVATRHSTRLRKPTAMVVDSSDEEEEDRRDESLEEVPQDENLEEVPQGESLKPTSRITFSLPEGEDFAKLLASLEEIGDDSELPISDRYVMDVESEDPNHGIVRDLVNVPGGKIVMCPVNAWIAAQPRVFSLPIVVPKGDMGSASSMAHRLTYEKTGLKHKTVAFPITPSESADEYIPYHELNMQERRAREYRMKKKAHEKAAAAGIKDFVFVEPADWEPPDPDYYDWSRLPEVMAMGGPAWP